MCGLIGYLTRNGRSPLTESVLRAMVDTLRNRGPDGQTTLIRDQFALGHARLSIIDLEGGTQPIFNETGNVACVLNGEIYNHRELRRLLSARGHSYRTSSDTESLVHLYEEFDLASVEHTVGMFAYAIADFDNKRMVVYRDRLGEKPLYYIDAPGYFACASEIKALQLLPEFDGTLDRDALAAYLRLGWIPGPATVYAKVRQLPPGCMLVADASGTRIGRYWTPVFAPATRPFDRRVAIDELDALLHTTMANKLEADVPVGVLLSGGLDSSAVVAYAQRHSTQPLRTFSVGFATDINELPLAKQVAERFRTDHTEIVIGTNWLDDLIALSGYLDEPFGDSSALPTFALARETRRHVKVVLTGDGGDELFAGYDSYLRQRRYSGNRVLRKGLGVAADVCQRLNLRDPVTTLYPLPFSEGCRQFWLEQRSFMGKAEVGELLGLPAGLLEGALESRCWPRSSTRDPLNEAFSFDVHHYLPDDLLHKVDRMAMCCSLETRAPLLDHRLVEFALRLPPAPKLDGPRTKSLLRETLSRHLPPAIIGGSKQGFGAPLKSWLAGEMRDVAMDCLKQRPLAASLVDGAALARIVDRSFRSLDTDWRAPLQLWNLLMLELWLRRPPPRLQRPQLPVGPI